MGNLICKCCSKEARWCGDGENACGTEGCDHIQCDHCGMHYSLELIEGSENPETHERARELVLAAYNAVQDHSMGSFIQPKLTGYRQLSEDEAMLMNEIKQKGVELGVLVEKLQRTDTLDQRWVAIGKTELQQGLMALIRSVAQPTTF